MNHRGARVLLAIGIFVLAACRQKPLDVPDREDLLRSPEEWLREEPIRLLRDYVRIPTDVERGEEAGARFLRDFFECENIRTEIVCPAPGRCNLLAFLPGRRHERALLLLNHIDVAGAFASLWKDAPPFEGRIQKGYLYGRGSYDMKSIGLSQALAVRHLKRHGIVPETDIVFLAEADEESRHEWGSKWLLEHRPELFASVGEVLNEGGTNEMILRDVRFWGIETLQAGYGSIELESSSSEALSALAKEFPRLSAAAVAPHPHVTMGFDMLANHLGYPLTDPLRHLDRVRRNPAELALLPDRYGCFLEPRIFWSSGYAFPPGQTRTFRSYALISSPPATAPDPYVTAIAASARDRRIRIIHAFSTGATAASPYPTDFTNLLRAVTADHFPGVPFGPVPSFAGVTTSIYFRQRGIPAYGFSPVAMNITDSSRRHANDERIFLRDYLRGVVLYQDILEAFALDGAIKTSPSPHSN